MNEFPPSLDKLINEFTKFPGIGPKTAERLALYTLKMSNEDVKSIIDALSEAKSKIKFCKSCFSITEDEVCGICKSEKRDRDTICVVENYRDVVQIEKTGEYRGLYHVLMGHIAPLEGVGPRNLKINELVDRIEIEGIKEIILATNPNVEGDATSIYIAKLLKNKNVKITRIARGLPVGGDLEFADTLTLSKSLQGRETLNID